MALKNDSSVLKKQTAAVTFASDEAISAAEGELASRRDSDNGVLMITRKMRFKDFVDAQ